MTLSSPLSPVEPNRHAPPPGLRLGEGRARFEGYQAFSVGADGWPVPDARDVKLRVKRQLLSRYFTPAVMRGRTVLDVGGNFGFFALWALAEGAARADVIDVDGEYVEMSGRAAAHLGIGGLRAHVRNFREWEAPADVVVALAMVHWLYAATTGYGSLEAVVRGLAARTRVLLLTEWVAPSDPAIEFLGHTRINVGAGSGPYTYAAFRGALGREFERVEEVGHVSPTRSLLACWRRDRDRVIRADCPMPLLLGAETVISASMLGRSADGGELWSRVYDCGETLVKQASAELIRREVSALRAMSGTGWAPELVRTIGENAFEMRRVRGEAPSLAGEAEARVFFRGILEALAAMRARGVRHRDIRPSNVLSVGGRPVLIDFGWAAMGTGPAHAPPSLGEEFRPRAGEPDDAYSVGKLMLRLLGGRYPGLAGVAQLMSEEAPEMRVSEPAALLGMLEGLAGGM